MSSNTQPLSGNFIVPLQRVSLNSPSSGIILDSDLTQSSLLIRTGNNSSFYIDKFSNVGINTTSPGTQLEIASANGSCLRLRYGSTSNFASIFMSADGNLSLNPSGNEVNTNASLNISSHDGSTIGLKLGGSLVAATAAQLNYIAVTPGAGIASKALVLDSNKGISGITSISSASIAGTLTTADQPYITSVGTLPALTVGNINITGNLTFSGGSSINTSLEYLAGITPGAASTSKALVLDSSSNITGIASIGTTSISIGGAILGSAQGAYLTSITVGTASGSKAVVLDSNRDITNIRNLTADQLTGIIQTGSQTKITEIGTLTSLTIGSATISGTEASYITGLTVGTASASKAIVLDSNRDITNIRNLTATGLYGIIQTSAQTLITSLGTLTGLNISGATTITATTDASSSTTGGALTVSGGLAVAKSVYIGTNLVVSGNLTVSGTTTTVNTTNMLIKDNTILLNSAPAGSYDSGILIQRYQTENDTTVGDVITDTAKETSIVSSATSSTIVLSDGNVADNYYVGWWIKSGAETRYISGYVGSTKTITVTSNFTNTPSNGATVSLYNKSFSALTWNESNKQFATTYAATDSLSTLTTLDYADLKVSKLFSISSVNVLDATESSSTSTGSIITSGGVGIAKALRVGNGIYGTIQTGAQTNITSLGTLSSLVVSGSITSNGASFSSTEINYLLSITPGTATSSKALIVDSNASITGIATIGTISLVLGGNTLGATQAGYLTGISTGTASAGKAVVLDPNRDITNIRNLTADQLTGIIQTGIQTNITAIGTLTSLTIGSSTLTGTQAAYLTGITAGTASASKAVVLDSNRDITNIRNLTADQLTGIIQTGSQTNITAIGTLASLTIGSSTLTGTQAAYLTGITVGTASASKAVVLDSNRDITNIRNLTADQLTGIIQTGSQTNITAIGTLTSLTIGSSTLTGTQAAYLTGITVGTAAASKALVVDASTNIAGLNSLSTTTLILNGVDVSSSITASGYVTGIVPGTATASKALVIDSSSNISGINSFGVTSLVLGSTTLGNTQAAYLTSITPGTATASKALIVDSSINIAGINSLSTTTLIVNSVDVSASISASGYVTGVTPGTATASKALIIDASSNISGVNSFGTTSLVLGSTTLGSTQAGYLTGITAGTASASKAIVLDPNGDITNIRNLTAEQLTGIIQTGSQTNITAIGTLASLTIGSSTLTGTQAAYLTGITVGTASASKAVVLDSNRDITNIRNLTADQLTGIIQTGIQTNITAIGTLTSLTIGSSTLTGTQAGYLTGITAGTAAASKALVVDASTNIAGVGTISNTGLISTSFSNATSTPSAYQSWTNTSGTIGTNLYVSNTGSGIGSSTVHPFILYSSGAARLWIAPTGEINIGSSSQTTYLFQVPGTFNATTMYMNGTLINSTATEINYLAGLTIGTTSVSKALVVDSSKNIAGIGSIGLTGEDIMLDLYTATATKRTAITCRNDTRTVEFGLRGTTNATNPNTFYILNNATYALLIDSNSNFGIGASPNSSYKLNTTALNATSYYSSGTALDFTGLPYISSITAGTAIASKAVVLDASKTITGLGSIGATSLVLGTTTITETEIGVIDGVTPGTATASKALILNSSSNLTTGINSLTATNIVVGTSTLTSTNAGYLVGITIGSASASKALILDASSNISGIGTLSASSLIGPLATAAQTAITSVGTLSRLTVSGNISGATLCLGTTTSPRTDTMITSYDSAQSTTVTKYIAWGKANTDRNAAEIGFLYKASSDPTNAITVGFPTVGARMTILAGGNVGIGATSPEYRLEVNGTLNATSYFVSGVASNLSFLTGITAGTATAGKALVLNASSNISGIESLSAASLTGALTTATQTAITSVGTLSSLTVGGNINLNGTGAILALTSSSSQITVNGNTDATNSTTGSVLLAGGIYVAKTILANANVTLQGVSSTLALNGTSSKITIANTTASTSGSTGAFQCAGGAYFGADSLFNTQISINGSVLNSTNTGYLTGITPGTGAASKALVLDSSKYLTGIATLCLGTSTDTSRNLSILNNAQIAQTSLWVLTMGQASSNNNQSEFGFHYEGPGSTSNELHIGFHTNIKIIRILADRTVLIPTLKLTDTTASTTGSTGALQCAGGAYFGGNSLFNTQISINGSVLTSTNAGYITGITVGTATASKALVLDSSKNLSGINNLITESNVTVNRGGVSGISFTSINGTSTCALNHFNNGDIYFGSSTANNLILQTGQTIRMNINGTTGNITEISSLTAKSLLCAGNISSSSWLINGQQFRADAATFTNTSTAASGTAASAVMSSFGISILAATNVSVTTTNAATVYIAGAPTAGTNMTIGSSYALWINSGNTLTGGNITMNGTSANLSLSGASSTLTLANTTTSTSSSTGALQCAGGAYFGGNSLFNTQISINGSVLNSTNAGYLTGITVGTATASKALVLDSSLNIGTINSLTTTSLVLGGNILGATQSGYLTGITAGTGAPGKALVLDSNSRISGISSICLGTSTDPARYLSILNSNQPLGETYYTVSIGQANTTNNQAEFGFRYIGSGSTSNALMLGFHTTTNVLQVTADRTVTIPTLKLIDTVASTTSSTGALQCAGGAYFGGNSLFNTQISINGSVLTSTNAGYLTSITAGTAAASKALVLDSGLNIASINSLGANIINLGNTNLSQASWTTNGIILRTGTNTCTNTSTAAVGTAASAVMSSFGVVSLAATNLGVTTTNAATVYIAGAPTAGTNMTIGSSYALWINSGNTLTGGNITMNGTSANLSLSGASSTLTLANTTTSTSSSTGALQCAGGAYFGGNSLFNTQISINGSVLNSTNAGYLTGITVGTATASKALVLDSSLNIGTINSLTTTSLVLGGNILGATQSGYLTGITAGAVAASKALVVDSNSKITGLQSLCLGTSTDTNRRISVLDSAQPTTTIFYTWAFGQANSPNNQAEFGFYYANPGSTSNGLMIGFHSNSNILQITADRTVTIPTLKLSDTAASTTSSTGALQCAGGAYFGGNSLFSGNITMNGTSANLSLSGASSTLTLANTTASTSSSTGALQCAGGAYFGGNSLISSSVADSSILTLSNLGTATTSRTTLLIKSNARTWEIGSRASTNTTLPSCFYLWDATAGAGRMTVNNTGGFLINPSTGAANALFHIRASTSYVNGGSQQVLQCWENNNNDPIKAFLVMSPNANTTSTNGAYIGTLVSNDFGIMTNSTNRLIVSGAGNVGIGADTPQYLLDVGGNVRMTGKLMVGTSTDTSHMISCLDGVTTSNSSRTITLGSANSAGNQAELTYTYVGNNHDSNRLSLGFHSKPTILNIAKNGGVGIGTTAPAYPLEISFGASFTITEYGSFTSDGIATPVNFNSSSASYSARFNNRIIVGGEVNVVSDRRKKRNIVDLDIDMCNTFVKNIKPSSYEYISANGQKSYGYIAQDIAKNGFHELVALIPEESLVETIDDDGFISPNKTGFVLSIQNIIPILHKSLKDAMDRIEKLEKIIELKNWRKLSN